MEEVFSNPPVNVTALRDGLAMIAHVSIHCMDPCNEGAQSGASLKGGGWGETSPPVRILSVKLRCRREK